MAAHYLETADTVLVVGSSLSRMSFTPDLPEGKTIIHATNDTVDLNKSYPTAVPILADAKLFLRQLADELRSAGWRRSRSSSASRRRRISPL